MDEPNYRRYIPEYFRLAEPAEYYHCHRARDYGDRRHAQPRYLPDHPRPRKDPHDRRPESVRDAQPGHPAHLPLPGRHHYRLWAAAWKCFWPSGLLAAG